MKSNKENSNIINLHDYKDVKIYESIVKNIRIYDDIQEYCFVLDYEMIYEKPVIDAVDIGDVFAVFLKHPATLEIVAVQFPFEWDPMDIVLWMRDNVLSYNKKDDRGYYVENSSYVIEGLKFKGNPLVLASRGSEKLYYEATDYTEVTDVYNHFHQILTRKTRNR